MLNRWIRYFPILDLLDGSPGSLLEVGSGSMGMGEFSRKRFIGCDVAFDSRTWAPSLLPVYASGTRLPFRDGAFHTVLCLDTMEHVPLVSREEFVKELLRVTAGVLIVGAPMGDKAAESDKTLHRYYASRNMAEPLWLAEHIALIDEFPQAEYFEGLFRRFGFRFEKRNGESAFLHVVVIILEHTKYVGRAVGWLSRRPWRHLIRPMLSLLNRTASYRTYLIVHKS